MPIIGMEYLKMGRPMAADPSAPHGAVRRPAKLRKFRSELTVYFILLIVVLLSTVGGLLYSWTKQTTEKMVSDSTVETLKQIDKNMHSMLGYVQDISLFIIANNDVRTFLKLQGAPDDIIKLRLYENLSNLTGTEPFIASINIYGANGLKLETEGPSQDLSGGLVAQYEKKIPKSGYYVITPTYRRYYQPLGDQYVISFYRQINDINDLTRKLGVLRIDIHESFINRLYRDIRIGQTGYAFVANQEGYIVSHSHKDKISQYLQDQPFFKPVFGGKEGYYRRKMGGRDMLITYYTSNEQSLIYVEVVPFAELLKDSMFIGRLILTVILLASLVALMLSYLIASKVTDPIKKLTGLMQRVERGDLDVVIDIERKDEIGTLAASFNRMIGRLKRLIDEVYKTRLKRKEAELKALQAQIDPHFLYNTLDTIYWTSRQENASKSGELVEALAKLFRLSLNKGNEITTIEKEVEHLNSYLFIQKMRYDREPQIEIAIDPVLYPYHTIKLILQPLVENALYHGIAEIDGVGKITITGREVAGAIVFEVSDNGVGMSAAKIREIFHESSGEKGGYGLKNVDERIRLYFGERYGLEIESAPGQGTRVRVRIPKYLERNETHGVTQSRSRR